jgi:hypothetical protein
LVVGVVESPAQHRGLIIGTVQLASVDRVPQLFDGVGAAGGEQQQLAPQVGPGWLIGQARHGLFGRVFQGRDTLCSGELLGGHVDCVNVSPSGFTEPRGWVVLIVVLCCCRPGRVVASQNLFE